MATITSNDKTIIGYDKTGKGPALIIVDGALGYRANAGGRPLAAVLSKNFTVITYDRRGRGESTDASAYSVEREIEDIEALISQAEGPVNLYGFSSGAVLALHAAAALKDKVSRLVLLEPPFGENTENARREFKEFSNHMAQLISEGKNSEAVIFFFQDMLPPEMIKEMKSSPDWKLMERVAPSLVYDNHVMGDGAVPARIASSIQIPTLVLVGEESPDFKHEAARNVANSIPRGSHQIIKGQMTLVPAEILAPILTSFFKQR